MFYYRQYVMDIDFDNIYLSDELRKIDAGRVKTGRPSVLPLKHFERDFYADPMSKQLRRREWFSISYKLLYIALIVVGVSGLFLIDWIYYTGLDVVRQNTLVNFTQAGSFNFTVKVDGVGLLARIIRTATDGLNVTAFQSMNASNVDCLPNPTLTDWDSYLKVYLVSALIFYMNINLMYSQRMMSVVCGHFFPKKHKMRVKYLYNQMLIRRRIYFEEGLLNLLRDTHTPEAHGLMKAGSGDRVADNEDQRPKMWQRLALWCGNKWRELKQKCCTGRAIAECAVCLEKGE